MDQGPGREMEDIMEETPDDLGHNWKKEKNIRLRKASLDFSPQGAPAWVFWGLAILVLILLVALFFGDGNKELTEDLKTITTRLDLLDKRLPQLESMEQKVSSLETQVKALQQSSAKLDTSGKSLGAKLSELNQKIAQLEKKAPSAQPKAKAPSAAQTKPTSGLKARHHEVRSGDTLYRIAEKYGVSVNDLRRLNKLTQKQDIYPGQKLLVTPGSNQ